MRLPGLKRLLHLVLGDYEAWVIYSIHTSQCREPDSHIKITPLDNIVEMRRPDVADELRHAEMYHPDARGFVAWNKDKPAGVCWLWPGPLLANRSVGVQPSECAELIQITVTAVCRGQGIAQALIMHAGCSMREMGYHRLYAQIWPTNTASVRAFQKSGWDEVAWLFQCRPRFWPRPLRLRAIRAAFRSNPAILANWRKTPAVPKPGTKAYCE